MSWPTVAIATPCQISCIVAAWCIIVHRETMDGPHRAGFAPRRRDWIWRISRRVLYKGPQLKACRRVRTCAALWEVLDSMVIGSGGASGWW
jgi:hypothetical protein